MASDHQRNMMASGWKFLVENHESIFYSQARPLNLNWTMGSLLNHFAAHHTVSGDCDFPVLLACKWAGLEDPTGDDYRGNGNSSSMFSFMRKHYTNPVDAHVGAIVVFGAANGLPLKRQHAAMVTERGKNPTLGSLGDDSGPHYVSLSAEKAAHPGAAVTFLDLSVLKDV